MTRATQFLYYALWIAHPVLQLAVAGVMWHRKLRSKFPVFFAYILSQVAVFALVFPTYLYGSYSAFFYVYWITAALSLALGFKVIHEIFLDVFRPYHTLKDLGTVVFKWAGYVMLLVAAVVGAASSTSEQGPLVQAVLTVQRCVRVIQCGLVLFLILFARYLGVSWRQRSFGVAAGFGGFAAIELIAAALRASSSLSERNLGFAIMIAYNLAILAWLHYMWAMKGARQPSENLLASQRWDQSLTEIQYPVPADSLIPMFENMVDRALSRTGQDTPPEPPPPAQEPSPSSSSSESFLSQMISDSSSESDLVVSTPLPRRPPEPR